ncbi:universal stress protein [Longimicrobium sp.]|uniref:universal stress protein n=1 Tax=Longimicrobium sp. TaxID=2029185 RepID=UPI002B59379E|nr:universal stress protein [Longimicrobium sp.]HSU16148.1 universal stress protein [Longimicrobium sp.]
MRLLTLKSVLVATDLDEASPFALRTAARLATLAGASLHLVHVADAPVPGGESRLRELFREIAPDAPGLESARVVGGVPAEAIVEQAARVGADVVILGPHRRGTGQTGELGSTAASIVRTAPCPCLVTATELLLPLERVIAAIDLSEAASGVLSVALSWASALRPRGGKARLTALHVTPDPGEDTVRRVREEVERARARARDASFVEIHERLGPGSDPAGEILRLAASDSADLLAVGTRGAAPPSSGLGSVSAAIARETPCPLLLVPPAAWMAQDAARV